MIVEDAVDADWDWMRPIYDADETTFGASLPRAWAGRKRAPKDRWIVVRPDGFAHFYVRRDGARNLHEIVVCADARGRGIGRALMEAVGRPVLLKTGADNEAANKFYAALGFELSAVLPQKRRPEILMNVWYRA